MTPFIELRSGGRFHPLEPVIADISIDDIAHALSHQCRFSGHTREHYSVAEHCVRVSELLEEWGYGETVQLWGLLHDASEAYLVDLPQPLKADPRLGVPYREAEDRVMRAVCFRFGLPLQEPMAVRQADQVLLATEARDLMPYRPEHWAKLTQEPLEKEIVPWAHDVAKRNFIAAYLRLSK